MNKKNQKVLGIYNPVWLIFSLTIPQAVLIWFFYHTYYIISPLLKGNSLHLWYIFGGAFALLVIGFTLYSIIQFLRKKPIHLINAILVLILYIIFSYLFLFKSKYMMPWNIPTWMIQREQLFLYYATCIMPCILYALLFIIYYFTPQNKNIKAWKNFIITILIPIAVYAYYTLILPLHKFPHKEWIMHLFCVSFIIVTVVFFSFLLRTIFILFQKKGKLFVKLEIVWIILIGLVCPIVGLYLNHHLKRPRVFSSAGIFGDFRHPLFYILAVFNGCLLLLPSLKNKYYRIVLFFSKIITLPFTAYFFIIFLPFLPFSMIAIIGLGAGFLTLSPLVLGTIHIISINNDYKIVKKLLPGVYLWLAILLSIIVIPSGLVFNNLTHRYTLHKALNYIYQPDYKDQTPINVSAVKLNKILKKINMYKESSYARTPYITPLYKWIVLDNLTLSYDKIDLMRKIFIDKTQKLSFSRDSPFTSSVIKIRTADNIKIDTKFDEKSQCYHSWIHLTINNRTSMEKEFAANIKLPEGTFISDYYLKINGVKEKGQIVEKKAALWVYNQIVRVKKDPGILIYKNKNNVALRVFPLPGRTKRYTGIKFIHPEPVEIKFNNRILKLGNKNHIQNKITSLSKNVTYIPSKLKIKLPKIKRKPYYHFILDSSSSNKKSCKKYINQIKKIIAKKLITSNKFKITFANYYLKTIEINTEIDKDNIFNSENFQKKLFSTVLFQGGFFLDRALKVLLFKEANNNSSSFPVFIVLSPDFKNLIYLSSLENFQQYYPESNYFYIYKNNKLLSCNFKEKELHINYNRQVENFQWYRVVSWPNEITPKRFLRLDNKPSIIIKKDYEIRNIDDNSKDPIYKAALDVFGMWQYHILYPEKTEKIWDKLIDYSSSTRIMSPATSYIVLENEAQRRKLNQVQKKTRKGKKFFNIGKGRTRMSEPGLLIILILLLLINLCRKYRIRKRTI